MTKQELLKEYADLCEVKGVEIDGIYASSNKSEIQAAIDCLKCPDETLDDYFTIIKLKYPNIYRTISTNGDFKSHRYNRFYVWTAARALLAD
jgi:hypothetical protein